MRKASRIPAVLAAVDTKKSVQDENVQANRLARFCMQPDISGMEQWQQ